MNLEQLFITLNYSYDVSDTLSVGVAPVLALQRFAATGLQPFQNPAFTTNPLAVTNNGHEWSKGAGLGLIWEASPQVTIGASYRTKINMDPFSKYSGLFANGGDFDIPATTKLGLTYSPCPELSFTAEWERIFHSDVAAISNADPLPSTGSGLPLGSTSGAGFGWKDMDVIRVGLSIE